MRFGFFHSLSSSRLPACPLHEGIHASSYSLENVADLFTPANQRPGFREIGELNLSSICLSTTTQQGTQVTIVSPFASLLFRGAYTAYRNKKYNQHTAYVCINRTPFVQHMAVCVCASMYYVELLYAYVHLKGLPCTLPARRPPIAPGCADAVGIPRNLLSSTGVQATSFARSAPTAYFRILRPWSETTLLSNVVHHVSANFRIICP